MAIIFVIAITILIATKTDKILKKNTTRNRETEQKKQQP